MTCLKPCSKPAKETGRCGQIHIPFLSIQVFKVFGISEICYSAQKSQMKWCFLSLQEQNKHRERMSLSWKKKASTQRGNGENKAEKKWWVEKNNWSTGDTEQKQTSSIRCFIRGVTTQPEVCLTHCKSKMKKGRRGERKKGERAERKEKDERREEKGTHGIDVLQGGITDGGAWTTPGTSAISNKVLIAFSRLGIRLSG